jgi:small-conductance mechanosensitive channel
MEILNLKIIETIIAIAVFILLRIFSKRFIDNTVTNSLVQKTSGKIIKKALNLILLLIVGIFILIIWGVDQKELAFYIGSILTVIGIALFAQWSILSNITSAIILFFNHSVKLDDTIIIIDKDFEIEGRVSDIGLFFVTLKTKEDEKVSIPNNVFIQKMIKQKKNV